MPVSDKIHGLSLQRKYREGNIGGIKAFLLHTVSLSVKNNNGDVKKLAFFYIPVFIRFYLSQTGT